MKRLLLALVLIASPALAQPVSQWRAVSGNNSYIEFADRTRIERTNTTVKVWYLAIFNKIQTTTAGEKYNSFIVHTQFDCSAKTSRQLGGTFYNGHELAASSAPREQMVDVVPESNDDYMMTAACLDQYIGKHDFASLAEAHQAAIRYFDTVKAKAAR